MRSFHRILVIAAAAAFGVLTWSLAHVLTYVLFAHTHGGAAPHIHVGESAGPTMIAMAAFVATSLVAVSVSDRPRWPQQGSLSLTTAGAPAAFLLIEGVEHIAAGNAEAPAALLVIGVVVHATMGAATPLLWHGLVRRTILSLQTSPPAATGPGAELPAWGPDRTWTSSSTPSGTSSRGPPTFEICRAHPCHV